MFEALGQEEKLRILYIYTMRKGTNVSNLFIGNFQNVIIKCALFLTTDLQMRRIKLYF